MLSITKITKQGYRENEKVKKLLYGSENKLLEYLPLNETEGEDF